MGASLQAGHGQRERGMRAAAHSRYKAWSPAFPLGSRTHALGSSGCGPPVPSIPPRHLHVSPQGRSIVLQARASWPFGVLGAAGVGCALTVHGGTAANRWRGLRINTAIRLNEPLQISTVSLTPAGKANRRRNRAGDILPLNPPGIERSSLLPPVGQQQALGDAPVGSAGCWQCEVLLDLSQMTRRIQTF